MQIEESGRGIEVVRRNARLCQNVTISIHYQNMSIH